MELRHILAFGSVACFLAYFLLSKAPRRAYLLGTLLLLPFIDLNLTPEDFGKISVFDVLSFLVLFFSLDSIRFSNFKSIYFYLFIALCVLVFTGSLASEFVGHALTNFIKMLAVFAYCKLLVDECQQDPAFSDTIINCIKAGCVMSLLFLIGQLLTGMSFTFYVDLNPNISNTDGIRYPSFFQDPQKYAQYLSMTSFLFLIHKDEGTLERVINFTLFSFTIGALLLTGSRAPFLGFCVGLLIVLSLNRSTRLLLIIVAIAGTLLVTQFASSFALFNRQEDYSKSFQIRNEIWKESLDIFYDHPILGVGIDNHHNFVMNHSLGGYIVLDNEIVYHGTENGYLKLLIELGLPAFAIVLSMMFLPLFGASRKIIVGEHGSSIFFIAAVVSWLVANFTVDSLSDKRIQTVLATFVCLLVVSNQNEKGIDG